MAKISGDGKLPKRIGEYIVYQLEGENIIRRKSGFTSKKINDDAKYVNSRNNASEFGKISALCKKMRLVLKEILPKKNNLAVCNSLVKKMRHLLVFDVKSARGLRNLSRAFENDEARLALVGYNFNPDCEFDNFLEHVLVYKNSDYTINFDSFFISKSVKFPDGANYFGLRAHSLGFDFVAGEGVLHSPGWAFFANDSKIEGFSLKVDPVKFSDIVNFVLLEAQFFVLDGGSYVAVADDSSKSVQVIAVNQL